jgi:hypothetical protein
LISVNYGNANRRPPAFHRDDPHYLRIEIGAGQPRRALEEELAWLAGWLAGWPEGAARRMFTSGPGDNSPKRIIPGQ